MRRSSAVRRCLLAALVAVVASASAAAASGCGSSSGGASGPGASQDASQPSVDGSAEGEGGGDGAAQPDAPVGPAAAAPLVYMVNASPDAPTLRFCLGLRASGEGGAVVVAGALPASPDQAPDGSTQVGVGVPPGLGVRWPDHGLDLGTLGLELFALDATNPWVAGNTASGGPDGGGLEAPCEALIGSDGLGAASDSGAPLVAGRDYWDVGGFAADQLGHGTTWLAAITGCVPGEASGRAAALCPAPYDASAGNLTLRAWALDTATSIPAGSLGAQLAQASSEWDDFARDRQGTVSAGFVMASDGGARASDGGGLDAAASDGGPETGADAGDAAAPIATPFAMPIATDAAFGTVSPAKLVLVPGLTFDGTTAFYAQVTDGTGAAVSPTPQSWPLPVVQAASWPEGAPEAGALRAGAGFVFVLLGNPAAGWYVNPVDGGPSSGPDAGGILNGHAPHVLAFPVANQH